MNNDDFIELKSEKELRVYMMPLRQKIIQAIRTEGRPVTSKYIADKLGISPSSASHHIKQLQQIGILEHDHTELINGITANYIRVTAKSINIGAHLDDEFKEDRDVITRNMIYDTYNKTTKVIDYLRSSKDEIPDSDFPIVAEILSGVAHLTDDECRQLYKMIRDFIASHETSSENTYPHGYMLISYRADIADMQERE